MTRLRVNPISLLYGTDLVFQYQGDQRVVRLSADIWGVLKQFYQLPTLAPRPVVPKGLDVAPFVQTGLLVPVDETEAFLRREGRVTWFGDETSIHYLLAAQEVGANFWFEHNGRVPLLLLHLGGGPIRSSGQVSTFDGKSFGFESGGALAGSKAATHTFLAGSGYRVPAQITVSRKTIPEKSTTRTKQILLSEVLRYPPRNFRFPVVVKPGNRSLGHGIKFAKNPVELAKHLVHLARSFDDVSYFVVETVVKGSEWRITAFADGSHAAYERKKFAVIGDGASTVRELIVAQNHWRKETVRRRKYMRSPTRLRLGRSVKLMLTSKDLSVDSRLPRGRRLVLAQRPTVANGAVFRDVTKEVPPSVISTLQDIRRQMGLARAGFDMIGPSLGDQLKILEVNGRPHLWVHLEPDEGQPLPVAKTMLRTTLDHSLSRSAFAAILDVCRLARGRGLRG